MEKKHSLSFCPACGARLSGDESICPFCGYNLESSAEEFGAEKPDNNGEEHEKHGMSFCPACGAKLDGSEQLCPVCGYKLTGENEMPPETDKPEPPAIRKEEVTETPPVAEPELKTVQPPVKMLDEKPKATAVVSPAASVPVMKKKKAKVWLWLLLAFFFLLLAGSGGVYYLQHTGKINLPFLANLIKNPATETKPAVAALHYYYCYAILNQDGVKEIILSDVFKLTGADNNTTAAGNKFNKMKKIRYPKDYYKFRQTMVIRLQSFDEAVKSREQFKKDYETRKFKFRFIDL